MATSTPENPSYDEEVYGPLNGAVNQTALDVHRAVDSAADAAQSTVQAVKPAIAQAQQAVNDKVDQAAAAAANSAAWLDDQSAKLRAASQEAMEDARAYVSAHPLRSVALAVAAGFLLGRLTR